MAKQAKLDRGNAASTSQFDFGGNWCDFAANHLSVKRIEEARREFRTLTSSIDLESTTFLDVGFGQGFGSLFAEEMGAKVVGIDSNPKCFEVVEVIRKAFPNDVGKNLDLVVGPILSAEDVEMLRAKTSRGYDVIHAWGVLHHTGKMAEAFANCAKLLSGEGHFIVAIYNAHWSSPFWKKVKHLYCLSERKTRKTMIWLFAPLVIGAKILVKKGSPFDKERGMDFIVDLVDWVGGHHLTSRLPFLLYCQWIVRRNLGVFWHVVFDQLVTPRTCYIERNMIERWLSAKRFEPDSTYIIMRNSDSWKFSGRVV